MIFLTYGLRNTWLDRRLENALSEHPSTSNIISGPKHCSKLSDSTFTIFIDLCGGNSGLKSLAE